MPVYNNVGDTIEGQAVDCTGKAFYPKGLKKHPITKKTMKLYTTDRTSQAVVRIEGVIPDDEELRNATRHFHRNVEDKVTGDALSVYTDVKTAVKIDVLHGKEGASHRHGTQFTSFRKHTIATVRVPLQNILKKLGLSNNSLIEQQDAN